MTAHQVRAEWHQQWQTGERNGAAEDGYGGSARSDRRTRSRAPDTCGVRPSTCGERESAPAPRGDARVGGPFRVEWADARGVRAVPARRKGPRCGLRKPPVRGAERLPDGESVKCGECDALGPHADAERSTTRVLRRTDHIGSPRERACVAVSSRLH